MIHCLESFGFVDVSETSAEVVYAIVDLGISSLWELRSPSGSLTDPFCQVVVIAERRNWRVMFIPNRSAISEMLSDAFAACMALHVPGTITSISKRATF